MDNFLMPERHRARRFLPYVVLLLSLSACTTVGPDYVEPKQPLPATWLHEQTGFARQDQDSLRRWWQQFQDPTLDALVERALSRNQDLNIAVARLKQAKAERGQIAADLGPQVSAGASGQARRNSKALDSPPGGELRNWQLGLDVSWELDLFGGTRRAIEAADAGIEALAQDHGALQVSLIAELVSHYAGLRATQRRLDIARDNVRNLRDTEQLVEQSRRRGLARQSELLQARAEREMAQAQLPILEADIARFSHGIGVLAGGFPGDWHAVLTQPAPALPVPPQLPAFLPSDLIRSRPDLRADERRLAAATAHIGQAQAQRFPTFRIPLGIGTAVSVIHDIFSSASLLWAAGLQAEHSLHDGGLAQSGIEAAQAKAQAAELIYERDVHLALREVEDALTSLHSQVQRQKSLQAALLDSEQALEHATQLYKAGLSAYLPILVAQRSANQARDALTLSQWDEVLAAIALYKSLGAGWQES